MSSPSAKTPPPKKKQAPLPKMKCATSPVARGKPPPSLVARGKPPPSPVARRKIPPSLVARGNHHHLQLPGVVATCQDFTKIVEKVQMSYLPNECRKMLKGCMATGNRR
eukprot:2870712-Ditylum_brightwellii.AAC.1